MGDLSPMYDCPLPYTIWVSFEDSDDGLDDYYGLIDEDDDPPYSWLEGLELLDDSSGTILTVPSLEHQVEQLEQELADARDQRDEWQSVADRLATFIRLVRDQLCESHFRRASDILGES